MKFVVNVYCVSVCLDQSDTCNADHVKGYLDQHGTMQNQHGTMQKQCILRYVALGSSMRDAGMQDQMSSSDCCDGGDHSPFVAPKHGVTKFGAPRLCVTKFGAFM